MTALFDRFTVSMISRTVTEIIAAYLTAYIAFGGRLNGPEEWVAVAQIILAIKLHVFAIPLAFTPALGSVSLWAWYVISVMWLSKAVHYSGYTVGEMVRELERAYMDARMRSRGRSVWDFTPEMIIVMCLGVIAVNIIYGGINPLTGFIIALCGIAILLSVSTRLDVGYGVEGGDV